MSTVSDRPEARWPRLAAWLKREAIAVLGVAGAALTVLAQLAHAVTMAPLLDRALAAWRTLLGRALQPPFELAGLALHPHLMAAVAFSLFMIIVGVGARIAARLSGPPLTPFSRWGLLEGMTWPSLLVFAGLVYAFLVGHDPSPSAAAALVVVGNEDAGQLAFAVIATAGYMAGDALGQRAFHARMVRLGAIVALTLAANAVALDAF